MTTPPLYKNLNANALGVSGRQSELNELALTYNFQGLDVDLVDLAERVEKYGMDEATQFIYLPVGQFELPIGLGGADAAFEQALGSLKPILEIAKRVKALRCVYRVPASSGELPYHENFERHRGRIGQLAELLQEYGIRLGLAIRGAKAEHGGGQFQFIQQAEDLLGLIKTIDKDNVGLALDSWNWKLVGGDIDSIKELGARKVVCVTLADISPETDIDAIELTDRWLPSDDGLVDNEGIVGALSELGYDGPITLMPDSQHVSGQRDDVVQAAAKTLDHLWDPSLKAAEEAAAAERAAASESSDEESADGESAEGDSADSDAATAGDAKPGEDAKPNAEAANGSGEKAASDGDNSGSDTADSDAVSAK